MNKKLNHHPGCSYRDESKSSKMELIILFTLIILSSIGLSIWCVDPNLSLEACVLIMLLVMGTCLFIVRIIVNEKGV